MIDGALIPEDSQPFAGLTADALHWLTVERQTAALARFDPQPGDRVLAVVMGVGLRWGWCIARDGDGRTALNLGFGRVVWVDPLELREVEQG